MPKKTLPIEGASIYFEVEGSGPYIVFIPGGDGGGAAFRLLRSHLTKYFTVILYDRRGYNRSKLNGPQDYENRLEIEADDIYKLMRSLTDKKFILFGSSIGGAVSLKYLAKYPETIYKMFVHEPMANLDALPHFEYLRKFHTDLYDTYKKDGKDAALKIYGKRYLNDLDYHTIVCKQLGDTRHNWSFHFEHEVRVYPFYNTNTDMIKNNKEKLVLLYGIECTNNFVYQPVKAISKHLDNELVPVPGGHLGYVIEPGKFAAEFIKICEKHSVIKAISKL